MFDDNKFSLQIIAKGAFVDDGVENGKLYIVEATTVRLNHVALNEWNRSECLNTRECYKDGPEGDAEWEAHKTEYAQRRKLWEEKLLKALGIYPPKGGVRITQAQSEVFTVVHIWKVNQEATI